MKKFSVLVTIIFVLFSITIPVASTPSLETEYLSVPSEYLLEKEDDACEKYATLLDAWSNDNSVSEFTVTYPSFYGGVYIDNEKNLVIQVTDLTDEIIDYFDGIIDLENVVFNQVDYSYSDLKAQYDIILNDIIKTGSIPSVNGVTLVEKDNSVNVYISEDGTASINTLSSESLDDYLIIDNVNFINDTIFNSCSSVEPGSSISFSGVSGYRSVGFWATDSNGNYGIVTASHGTISVDQQATIGGSSFGTVTQNVFSGTVDVAFVKRSNSNFSPIRSITDVPYHISGYTTSAPEGATVITVGANTGIQTGTILSSSASATYNGQTLTDLFHTSTQVNGGDSGGIVLKLSSNSNVYICGMIIAKSRSASAPASDPGTCVACKFINIKTALNISMY